MQGGDTTPNGGVHVFDSCRGGQSVFVELAAIAKDVFRDVTQVDVELSGVVGEFLIGEGVHQPEFDVFDVGGFKVYRFHLAHDATPAALRVVKLAFFVDTC